MKNRNRLAERGFLFYQEPGAPGRSRMREPGRGPDGRRVPEPGGAELHKALWRRVPHPDWGPHRRRAA